MYFSQTREEGNNHPALYIGTVLLIIFANILPQLLVVAFGFFFKGGAKTFLNSLVIMTTVQAWIFQMIIGLLTGGTLLLCFRLLHKKRIKTLFTASPRFRLSRFFLGAGIWFILTALSDIISFAIEPESYQMTFTPQSIPFLMALFPTIIVLATLEEMIFRGYLFQGFGLLTKNKLTAMLICAFIFGSLHIPNPELKEYGALFILPQYYLMGLFFAFIVIMENGLEMALGIHIINNIYGGIIVGFEGSVIPAQTIFKIKEYDPLSGLIFLLIFMVIFCLIYILIEKGKGRSPLKEIRWKI